MPIFIVDPGGRTVVNSPFTVSGTSSGRPTDIITIQLQDDASSQVVEATAVPSFDGYWSTTIGFSTGFNAGDTATLCATLQPGGSNTVVQSAPLSFTGHGTGISEAQGNVPVATGATAMLISAQLASTMSENIALLWRMHDVNGTIIKQPGFSIVAGLLGAGPFRISVPINAVYIDFICAIAGGAFCDIHGNPPGCETSVAFSDITTNFNPLASVETTCATLFIQSTSPTPAPPPPVPPAPPEGGTTDCCADTQAKLDAILAAVRRNY